MGYLADLTDEQWAWVEPVFPPQEGPGRRRTVSLRRVLDALMYQDRTGCQWRLIPLDFPPSGTVRYYFDKWNDDGTMLEIHDRLRRAVRMQQGRDPDPTAIVMDSQSVKTAEAGDERGFDGGKQVDGRNASSSLIRKAICSPSRSTLPTSPINPGCSQHSPRRTISVPT